MITLNLLQPDAISEVGSKILNDSGLIRLILKFALNFAVVMVLARWLYYSTTRRKDYLFTYILISTIVFFLCYSLENVNLQLGFALGLFAIFGILRYRTDAMPIKEMTYLFIIIGISVINSLSNEQTGIWVVLFINIVIILITISMEKVWLLKHEASRLVLYEKINLINPENSQDLLEDLQKRTGIKKINRFEIGKIDFLRDTCEIKIFFDVTDPESTISYRNGNKNNDDDD
jgi:Domain of unknown function (DUF4956)